MNNEQLAAYRKMTAKYVETMANQIDNFQIPSMKGIAPNWEQLEQGQRDLLNWKKNELSEGRKRLELCDQLASMHADDLRRIYEIIYEINNPRWIAHQETLSGGGE